MCAFKGWPKPPPPMVFAILAYRQINVEANNTFQFMPIFANKNAHKRTAELWLMQHSEVSLCNISQDCHCSAFSPLLDS